jgi:hypothetical protein
VNVEPRANHAAFVDSANKFNDNFVIAVIVDNFEFSNITMLQHYCEKLHNYFGARSDQNLAFTTPFRVGDALEAIVQHTNAYHFDGDAGTEIIGRSPGCLTRASAALKASTPTKGNSGMIWNSVTRAELDSLLQQFELDDES